MTNDNQPQEVSAELFEAMARLQISLPMTGYELSALLFVLEAAIAGDTHMLAMAGTPEEREITESLHKANLSLKERADQAMVYLSIVAKVGVAAADVIIKSDTVDRASNAPTTAREQ